MAKKNVRSAKQAKGAKVSFKNPSPLLNVAPDSVITADNPAPHHPARRSPRPPKLKRF
jgi:hypothetical protein